LELGRAIWSALLRGVVVVAVGVVAVGVGGVSGGSSGGFASACGVKLM